MAGDATILNPLNLDLATFHHFIAALMFFFLFFYEYI